MEHYTVEQAASLLGLHVKTVRGYVRDGRLKAVKVGKRYRIAREDLEAFAGLPLAPPRTPRRAEASIIVAAEPSGVRAEFAYDEEQGRLKVIVLGGLEAGAQVLRLIDALVKE